MLTILNKNKLAINAVYTKWEMTPYLYKEIYKNIF